MILDIDDRERDLLLEGLGTALGRCRDADTRREFFDLLKRLATLPPDPDVGTLDVSLPGWMHCTGCGASGTSEVFAHRPNCPWEATYGG